MTYTIPTSNGLTATQKAWLNLFAYICLLVAGGTGFEALAGNLPAWVVSIPAIAGALAQLIQLYLSGRLDPQLALIAPSLQVVLAQLKQQSSVITPTLQTTTAPLSVAPAASTPTPTATVSPLSPGFVNLTAAAPDI
jgi:hypothetical protein